MPAEPNNLTPLDNSLLIGAIPLSDGSDHLSSNIPTVLAGGKKINLKNGQHIAYPMNTDYGNLLLTMIQAMGIQISTFNGNSTPLSGLFG
jgi:hypothetical protein